MNISIFGLGYVGCVSMGCLAQLGHDITGVDVNQNKIDLINRGKPTIIEKDIERLIQDGHKKNLLRATSNFSEAVLKTDVSIIAVGTPSSDTGHLNLSYIFRVAENIGKTLKDKTYFHVVVIRSTVLPGTCENVCDIIEQFSEKKRNKDFAVLSNPEFLREGTAVNDYYNPPYTLIGGEHKAACETIAELYKPLPGEIVITATRIAEVMKYLNNSFHALKISFANEVGNICKEINIDSHKVMEIFVKDTQLNLSPYYLKPGFAYGGSCLPKDLKALQTLAHDNYLSVPVLENIHKTNEQQISRAIKIIEKQKGKKIGFLGLSFKAGTDDLRNSPAVTLIESLIGKGFETLIYDKNILGSRLTGTNKDFIDHHIPHLSKLLVITSSELICKSDVIVVNTKEEEFVSLLQNENKKQIIDLVRINEDFIGRENYVGINW
jgi:GDP-mannose 6-dehydrogenase